MFFPTSKMSSRVCSETSFPTWKSLLFGSDSDYSKINNGLITISLCKTSLIIKSFNKLNKKCLNITNSLWYLSSDCKKKF